MSSPHTKTWCFGTAAALIAVAMLAAINLDPGASRPDQLNLMAPGAGADNGPALANRTLVPRAVRLVIGFRPTATT